jgi:flagellar motor switch/type III secretory pathway protein FliN
MNTDKNSLEQEQEQEQENPQEKFEQPTPQKISIALQFFLSGITISLAELKNIQIGQTFNTRQLLTNSVSIFANGLLIARGDLVEIEGQLGVTVSVLTESTIKSENQCESLLVDENDSDDDDSVD